MLKRTLLAAAVASLSPYALADKPAYEHWVGGFVEHYNPDGDKPSPMGYLESGEGFGIEYGHRFDPHWAARLEWSELDLDVNANTIGFQNPDNAGRRIGVDAMYFVDEDLFYVFGGLKHASYGNKHNMANLGLGKHWEVSDKFRVISEAAVYHDFGESHRDVGLKLGLAYIFGDVAGAKIMDSDNDGVIDSADLCPNSPAGTVVDNKGCVLDSDNDGVVDAADNCPNTPAGRTVDSMGCDIDSDNDGVPNTKDMCPDTPSNTKVGAKGCSLATDADQDGVLDADDKCANTPITDKVDATGCSVFVDEKVSVSLRLNFANNSAEIENPTDPQLAEFAAFMKRFPNTEAVIEGHTSTVGNADYNKRLSGQRAVAVKELLINKYNIQARRLVPMGYGEERPLDDADTAEAHANNRRIEAVVTATKKVKLEK